MALIHSTASGTMEGKVGNTTYYTESGRQLARTAYNSSNYGKSARRSYNQQKWRVRWANLVNFYRNSQGWMYYAFESKKKGQTDYNKFMSLNVNASALYLTKNEAACGGCIASNYLVSEGTMFPITMTLSGDHFITNIATTLEGNFNSTTIAALTADLIACNTWLEEGCQISFISYQQYLDENSVPRVICTPYELTLDLNDNSIVSDYLPEFCFQGDGEYIITGTNVSPGAHCFVLSQTKNGKTYVSTQRLVAYQNEAIINEYGSESQLNKAIESYGVDDEYFLESGSEETSTTPQPISINSITINGTAWDGKTLGQQIDLSGNINVVATCAGELTDAIDPFFYCYISNSVNILVTASSYTKTISGNIVTFAITSAVVSSGYSGTARVFNVWQFGFAGENGNTQYTFGASSAAALGYTPAESGEM